MSQLLIPITGKVLFATGNMRLWAEIVLQLKDRSGSYHQQVLRVDTATDITTFPAFEAKQFGLPMPAKASVGATHAQTGLEIRSGLLRFRIAGMDPDEYAISCLFLGDPDTPPDPTKAATFARKLLQPLQLLNQLHSRWTRIP